MSARAAALLSCLLAAPATAIAMWGGDGTVLNSSSGAPMPGVTVSLECNKGRWIHGWDTIKTLSTLTDKDGRFSFSLAEVWRCDFAFVRPSKEGFSSTGLLDSRYADTRYEEIPSRLFLTPAGEENLQRIKYHVALSQGRSSDPKHHYRYIYGDFISSAAIARTGAEIKFVQDSFCARLDAADAQLTAVQREELGREQGGFPPRPISHERFVLPYCAGG